MKTYKVIHAQELKLVILLMTNKSRILNAVRITDAPGVPTTLISYRSGRRSNHTNLLFLYGIVYINKTLLADIVSVKHLYIIEPEHELFSVDVYERMCFQHSIDLSKDPNEHLFHLTIGCTDKPQANFNNCIIS